MNFEGRSPDRTFAVETATAPIAVVGIGCRFPGGINGPDEYWDFLANKRSGIREVPADRWNVDAFYSPDPGAKSRTYARYGGFMTDDVFGFDPAFFDMSPREVTAMDPQQRIALQVSYEATQDAGMTLRDLQRASTGVFLGISTVDFANLKRHARFAEPEIFAGTGSAFSIAANRISHRFGLSGPSIAVDTACSSALVALDQAVRHLSMGTCDMAFAGGVNCMLDPGPYIAFSGANMLSNSGSIFMFDERADGFVRGEGCGIVLLRRLDDALAAGNRIYGVIRQSMVNQDGATSTLTAPDGDAQQAMLEALADHAGIDPYDVDYVEAHGTGTPVGDPIEATAIGRVFGSHARADTLYVGSNKPNIGHLESAAGSAGFIKALLVAQRGTILPNVNWERPNPDIPFGALNMAVPTETMSLDRTRLPAVTVVNSFGFGGTNASVLIEQWRETPRAASAATAKAVADGWPAVVPISAQSEDALGAWAARLADAMDEGGALGDASFAQISAHLGTQRDTFSQRAAFIVPPDRIALQNGLRAFAEGGREGVVTGQATTRSLAMLFSGQGGQWWAMARRMLEDDPAFRASVEEIDAILKQLVGWSTVEEMLRPEADSRINTAEVTQAAIFSTQMALYRHWQERGITPQWVAGHSFGEVAAACATGYIALEDAVRLIALRGQIPKRCSGTGAMAAIGLPVDELLPLLEDFDKVCVGAFNGPVAQTISGYEADILNAMERIAAVHPDVLVRRIQMDFAWHSVMLDEVEDWFRSSLGTVTPHEGRVPLVSTVTGKLETHFDEEYWWQNLRQPVSFTKGIDLCLDLGANAFLELGPHATLTPLVRGIAQERGADAVAVTSLDRKADDFDTLTKAQAQLFVAGVQFDTPRAGSALDRVLRMPWNNQPLRSLPEETEAFLNDPIPHPLLGRGEFGAKPLWMNDISLANFKFLADHAVGGDVLFPGVGYIEMMGAALRDHHGDGPVELRDFVLHEATSFTEDDIVLFATALDPVTNRITIATKHRGAETDWVLRAEAYGFRHDFDIPAANPDAPGDEADDVAKDELYRLADRHGLQYGPSFRLVDTIRLDADHAVARIEASDETTPEGYFAFPGAFDCALQASIAVAARDDGTWDPGAPLPPADEDRTAYNMRLPIGARKILLKAPLTERFLVESERGYQTDALRLKISSDEGEPLIVIEDFRSKVVGTRRSGGDGAGSAGEARVYTERLVEQSASPSAPCEGSRWLVLGDGAQDLAGVTAELERRGALVSVQANAPGEAIDAEDMKARIDAFLASDPDTGRVLFCADFSHADATDGAPDAAAIFASVSAGVRQLLAIAQACEMRFAETGTMAPVAIVTRASRPAPGSLQIDLPGVAGSALIGTARTFANELKHPQVLLIDADEEALSGGAAIADALTEESEEREFVIRGDARFVSRLETCALDEVTPVTRVLSRDSEATNFGVTMTSPGSIDKVVLQEMEMPACGPDDVIVEVAAVGLNFRDIMAATSILPGELEGEEAYWRNLGLEFAGTVHQCGGAVEGLAPGDKVMGMGKGFLRRYARSDARALMRLPDDADLKAAATMPVAFLTAHYALRTVGQLEDDETVLVHLASGGVGLAAIQVARDIGARVFGTAGSDAKRAHLQELGLAGVMNSRSLEFAEDLLAQTGGRGVDVVLNALSGAGIDKSLECLAPFGRMVEIGKRDLAEDKPIGLGSLYRNNAYSVIDLSTLAQDKPRRFARLLAEVEEKVAAGEYQPLAVTHFPVSRAAEAMRTLFQAQHIGKIVVGFDEPEVEVQIDAGRDMRLSGEASYLVTGGLKGFGAVIGNWLSQRGAGTVVLANRSGEPDEEARTLIGEMEGRGTRVEAVSLDVTDAAAVADLFAACANAGRGIRGIVHGAAVIDDSFISQLDRQRLDRVLEPKVAGAINLHNAACMQKSVLDFFLSMSSIAETVGSAGQANYTAANAVLNAVAAWRRAQGLAGQAVAWGAIGGAGFISRSEALANYLESAGIRPIPAPDAAAALDQLLQARDTTLAYANLDWAAIGRANPAALKNPRTGAMVSQKPGQRSRLQQELMGIARDRWEETLADHIRLDLAKVLKVEAATIADDRKLSELGLDSLSAFELKNRIEASIEIEIPIAQFIQAPTIAKLAALIAGTLDRRLELLASNAAAGMGTDGEADRGARFEPAVRQLEALAVETRSMSTPAAAHDNRLSLTLPIAPEVSDEDVANRLEALAAEQIALRLHALQVDGQWALAPQSAPTLESLDKGESLGAVELPGPLWRFAIRTDDEGERLLSIAAHRAAADPLSVQHVARSLCETQPQPLETNVPQRDEHDRRHRASLAYWRETLRRAAPAARIAGRKRVAAPPGLGRNRGAMATITAAIELDAAANGNFGETLLTAWVRTLSAQFGLDSLTVDYGYSERTHGTPETAIGVFDSFVPLILDAIPSDADALKRTLISSRDAAVEQRALDTPAIERAFGDWLGARSIDLRQFGFIWLDPRGANDADPLAAAPLTPQEIQLAATMCDGGVMLRLAADSDVIQDKRLDDLFSSLVETLADMLPGAGALDPQERHRARRDWPQLERRVPKAAVPACLSSLPDFERETANTLHPRFMKMFEDDLAQDDTQSRMILGKEFIVRPHLDLERVRGVIATIIGRHEAIRRRYVRDGESYFSYISSDRSVDTYFAYEEVADEDAARARASEIAQEPTRLGDAMFRSALIRFDSGDMVVGKANHLVFDGYALGLVMEEIVQAYLGLPLAEVEMDLETFNREYLKYGDTVYEAERDAFWEELYRDPPPAPNIGRIAKGIALNHELETGGITQVERRILTEAQSDALKQKAKTVGVTTSQMVMAAFAKAICLKGGVEEVFIQCVHSFRVSRRLENFVHNVVNALQLRIAPFAYEDIGQVALAVAESLNTNIAYPGAPRYSDLHERVKQAGSYITNFGAGEVTSNKFVQDTMSAPMQRVHGDGEINMGMYTITNLPPQQKPARALSELELRCFLLPEQIGIQVVYDTLGFDAAEIAEFLDLVVEQLEL